MPVSKDFNKDDVARQREVRLKTDPHLVRPGNEEGSAPELQDLYAALDAADLSVDEEDIALYAELHGLTLDEARQQLKAEGKLP